MMEDPHQQIEAWYHSFWGVLFAGLGGTVVLIGLILAGTTFRYWWQITHGQKPGFLERYGSQFTSAGTVSKGAVADRKRLETSDDPALGSVGAPLTIVEFVDFKCPNSKLAAPSIHQLAAKYGGKVRVIVRDFPVESSYPGTTELSELAFCAKEQGRFWQMHDTLYEQQGVLPVPLSQEAVAVLADRAGADATLLINCLKQDKARQEVAEDYVIGSHFGVGGTPTYFINGQRVEGAIPFSAWEKFLDNR